MTNHFVCKQQFYFLQILLLLFIGNKMAIHAQTLSGKVVNEKQIPIEYANVILFHAADSSFINGTVCSETGEFSFENVQQGELLVQIACLGYQTITLQTIIQQQSIELGEIMLTEDNYLLSEIVVTTPKPVFSKIGNNWIVHVNSSLLASVGNANDVIKRIPGVTINEDEITVFGKGTPIVYINNRKLYDKTELNRLSSTNIISIELITNPGAKYDAEGRAVLLIKTKRSGEDGWSVQISQQVEKRKYFSSMEDFELSYALPNFVFFASCNHTREKTRWNTVTDYVVYTDTTWLQKMEMPQKHKDLSTVFTSGIDWSVTTRQAVGCQYQYTFGNEKINSSGIQTVWANAQNYDQITTLFKAKSQPEKHLLNAFYKGDYGKSFSLRLDVDYLKTHNKTGQEIMESSSVENRELTLNSRSNYDLYAGKFTLEYRLNELSSLEFGGECNQVKGSGFLLNPEQYIADNFYTNKENKVAGFANYSRQFGKLAIQIGMRYEWTKALTTIDSARQVEIDRNYSGFYPSLSISQIVGNTQMGLEMARKIQRPAFSLLSSEDYYVNRFLRERGNPLLNSEDMYLFDYHLHYRILDFRLDYTYVNHPIGFTIEDSEQNSSQTVMTYVNYPKYQKLDFLLTGDVPYKFGQTQVTVGVSQPFFNLSYLGKEQSRNRTVFFCSINNEFVLPRKYIFSLNLNYQGKMNNYAIETNEMKSIEIGLRKYFFNKKLLANLQVTDLFNWINNRIDVRVNTVSYTKMTKYETRALLLTIRYQFNNYKKQYRGANAALDDINRL
ncbi:MAG: outer membrane beta-barrel protein [Candidatus Azobacteroides sp.]|nr:outer membrane beta-barrel protein [Candidatus Azobacteroides sp.]